MKLDVEYGIAAVLLAIHWGPLLLAAWLWPLRKISLSIISILTLIVCLPCGLLVLAGLIIFTDVNYTAQGNGITWYMIYSIMSLGLIPATMILAHIMTGRLAGYVMRKRGRGNRKPVTINR
ncbi:MAG: hypothetical protein AAGC77_01540 [Pseudomonadota bacterium]